MFQTPTFTIRHLPHVKTNVGFMCGLNPIIASLSVTCNAGRMLPRQTTAHYTHRMHVDVEISGLEDHAIC